MTPSVTRRPSAPWIAALLITCGAALVLRVVGLRYGLPAVYNPDEVAIMSRALAFAKGDLNPHNFLYPSLYFYVLFAWEGLTAVLAVALGQVASFGAFQREFFLDPTRVYVAGRLLTALCGTATVAATYALGRRVAGSAAGLMAAAVVAVAPLHVRDSHYVKHDVPATLLVVLAYLAFERLMRERDSPAARGLGPVIAAGAVTGAAFSTHYYTIFLAIPLAWSAALGARSVADGIRRIAVAAFTATIVFFLLSPFVLVEPVTALRDIRANRQIVVDRAVETLGYVRTAARYASILWNDAVGPVVPALSLIGLVVLALRSPRTAGGLLAFALPFFLFVAGTYPASRYLIPLIPFVAVFAGVAVAELAARSRAAALAIGCAACLLPFWRSVTTDLFIREADTRTLAQRFIEGRVPSGATVLTQPYSVPLEPSKDVLREAVQRSGREMPTKTRMELERDPYPTPSYRLIYLGFGLDADKLYLPYDRFEGRERPLHGEHIAFVVLKRYNRPDPATLPFLTALAREGRLIGVVTPYREGPGNGGAEPFLHNTDARIDASLERPGPIVEIWQLDGSGS